MSEFPVAQQGPITLEKISVSNLPPNIQQHITTIKRKKEKHVGVLQRVDHPGLTSVMADSWYAFFQSPLTAEGFRKAGDHAIGLIIQPRARSTADSLIRALTNSSTVLNAWGHTALYVRIDGKIQRVIGFDPYKISTDVILRGTAVTTGKLPTAGHYNDDSGLFHNNSARSVEYAVDRELALHVLESMPHHGPASKYPGSMQKYIGSPGKYKGIQDQQFAVGNCISFAMNTIKKQLGVDIYAINADDISANTAIVDLGGKLMANQGVLSRNILFVEKDQQKTLVLRWTSRKGKVYEVLPKLGGMPTSFVIIKGLGHIYLLTSVARFTTPYITSMLPSPLYEMVPSAPWLLQSGALARHSSVSAFLSALETLSDQYIAKETLTWLYRIGMLAGTVYLLIGGDDDRYVEIVYGAMSSALPYILEWLAQGIHRATGM